MLQLSCTHTHTHLTIIASTQVAPLCEAGSVAGGEEAAEGEPFQLQRFKII